MAMRMREKKKKQKQKIKQTTSEPGNNEEVYLNIYPAVQI